MMVLTLSVLGRSGMFLTFVMVMFRILEFFPLGFPEEVLVGFPGGADPIGIGRLISFLQVPCQRYF